MKPLRVTVLQAWDTVTVPFDSESTIAAVKAAALKRCRVMADPGMFVVKYHGAALLDEQATVAESGLQPGSPLIALRIRRRAVR